MGTAGLEIIAEFGRESIVRGIIAAVQIQDQEAVKMEHSPKLTLTLRLPSSQPRDLTLTIELPASRPLSRVLSAWLVALGCVAILERFRLTEAALGKTAFLAQQALRFDRYYARPSLPMAIESFVLLCMLLGIYELLGVAIERIALNRIRAFRSEAEVK